APQTLGDVEQQHLAFLLDSMRQNKVEGRLARGIGDHIRACSLQVRTNFLSPTTQRYQLDLVVDEGMRRKAKLNKRIAKALVFDTPQLHQLDFKAEGVLRRIFQVLEERYVQRSGRRSWHFLPESVEHHLEAAGDTNVRARLICDWIANLTDRGAWRVHQRLFDVGSDAMGGFL
ncbi:MAG: hypothetical protein ACOYMN_17300, partial [Roseimicrobium sp.]